MLKLTEAILENRHDGEESTRSREEGVCGIDSVPRDTMIIPALPLGGAVIGEVRKSCRPGE
jgi:hypothetical protein